jgi:hypothetical protein
MIDPASMVPSFQDAPLEVYDELSRYRGLPLVKLTYPDGSEVVYVGRRFLPQPQMLAEIARVNVREGDRLDILSAQQFGDARWWWRLADANAALDPADLTARIGEQLRITLPEGVPVPRQG